MMRFLIAILFLGLFSCSKLNKLEYESFDKYDKIRLVSYSEHRKEAEKTDIIKLVNDSIEIPKVQIIDNIVLDNLFSDKILKILSSKDYKDCSYADCYQPRHVLLFYKNNSIVDFYEFCASCGGSRQSKGIKVSDICSEQGIQLVKVFKEMKLKNNGEEGDDFKYF